MQGLTPIHIDCPWCGEGFETFADTSAGDQAYVEDCQVCCSPIVIVLRVDWEGALGSVEVRREND